MRARISSAVALTSRPGRDPLHQPQDHPQVLHVGPHRLGDARVLHLDRHVAPVVQPRAVDLPDRGGGDRLVLEGRERLLHRLLELGLDHLAHVREAHLRRRVAQLAELALELLAVLLGHEADVEEAHDLPELHRGALHRPERGDDLLGGLEVAALERLVAALLACAPGSSRGCRGGAPPGRPRGWRPSRCARAARSGSGPSPSAPGWRASGAGVDATRRRRRAGRAPTASGWRSRVGARGLRGLGRRRRRPRRAWPWASASSSRRRGLVLVATSGRRTGSCGGRWRPSRRTAPAPTR